MAAADAKNAENAELRPLAVVVREVYLERQSGVVDVDLGPSSVNLFFRHGELYLDRDDPAARKISPLLAVTQSELPAADPEIRAAMGELAQRLARDAAVQARFRTEHAMAVELIGPLPTVCFVQELAVHACDESELMERVGGAAVKLRSSVKTPALQQLPGLDDEMSRVLVSLSKPITPADLLRGAGTNRLALLRGLTKLWSVGLVRRERPAAAGVDLGWRHEVLSSKVLEKFSKRIAEQLEVEPVEMDAEQHRKRLADLLSHLGEMDFYQLLDIEPKATETAVFAAYSRLARIVHPSHAERLGLRGKEVASRVLFEKATEAYLTLSDPLRRASYNTVAGVFVRVEVGSAQRREEKRSMAEQNYRRAGTCLAQMDFSLAVDLLKEATRLDPKPEYFARLAQAQAKNPKWHGHAVASYGRALELDPDNAGTHAGCGNLFEHMGRIDEAREQYKAALEAMPGHVEAGLALERLGKGGGLASLAPKTSGGFRSLFGKTEES